MMIFYFGTIRLFQEASHLGKLVLALSLVSYGLSTPLHAGEFSAQIKNLSVEPQQTGYVLNADLDYVLSPTAKAAIQSSIPLCWHLKIRLKQQRYFYDQTVLKLNYYYRIRYHALLNTYSVKNETSGVMKKYSSLLEAFDSLSRLRGLPLISIDSVKPDNTYKLAIKLEFDKAQLPPPLRPIAYLNDEWDLSSDWYVWPLKN
jgi:hypothetical protein